MKIRKTLSTPAVMAGMLVVLTLGIASAKSYKFVLPAASTVAGQELKADQRYSVQVNGAEAVIKGENYGKAINVPVNSVEGATKYEQTSVEKTNGANTSGPLVLKAIKLGGTKTKLVLAP